MPFMSTILTNAQKMTIAKEKLMTKRQDCDIEVGQIVLMRIPGITGKLDVNYEIVVPNYRNKRKVMHINNLKTWVE